MRVLGKVAFAAEPVLHRFPELVEGNTGADLHLPVSDGKGIVKNAGIGEIAHRKRIQPLQRAWKGVASVFILHTDLAGEHTSILNVVPERKRSGISL